MSCYSEAGFKAVERRAVVVVLVPALAEEQCVLVEEEVALHGFESGQLLHSHCCPFMANPHVEATLHHDTAELDEIPLNQSHKINCTATKKNKVTSFREIRYSK